MFFETCGLLIVLTLSHAVSDSVMDKQENLLFASVVLPTESSQMNAVLLAASIREFGGSLAHVPIYFFVPEYGEQLTLATRDKLDSLNVRLVPVTLNEQVLRFPLAHYPLMAAAAESLAQDTADFLVWLGTNTIVLQEPVAFMLPNGKNLGYRPVHHTNVGSPYGMLLDSFWKLVYEYCNVPEDRIFPMKTHVDGATIRPYFNAGCLITRPEKGLFTKWRNTFFAIYQENSLQKLYQKDERYAIFVHQAILSGIILSMYTPEELYELPCGYNYPLHLHAEDITDSRPSKIEQCITIRHEGFYRDPSWAEKIPAHEPLKQWLAKHLQ